MIYHVDLVTPGYEALGRSITLPESSTYKLYILKERCWDWIQLSAAMLLGLQEYSYFSRARCYETLLPAWRLPPV